MKTVTLLTSLLVGLLMAANSASAEGVYITNFPEVQTTQDVNSIPKTMLQKLERVEVGQFTTLEVIDLSDKYTLETGGYTQATVSMFGFPKSINFKDCRVGVVLLPNEKAIVRAWHEDHEMILAEEVSTNVSSRNKYFQGQIDIDLHFPNYTIGFYNTCKTNVELSLYSYLR